MMTVGCLLLLHCLSETMLNETCKKLELLFYKVIENDVEVDIEKGYPKLSFIKSFTMSQSTSILSGICKYKKKCM